MTGPARALGVALTFTIATVVMVAGLVRAFTATPCTGAHWLGSALVLAGGLLLVRLWCVQSRAVRHLEDDGTERWLDR